MNATGGRGQTIASPWPCSRGSKESPHEAVIISLFEKVLNKECVLVQDKTFRKLPLLSTLTRSYKVQRELKKVILKHVNEKWAGELGAETNWEDLAAEIPELDSEQELRKMESALTFEYTSSLISKSKTAGAPPPALHLRWISSWLGSTRRTCGRASSLIASSSPLITGKHLTRPLESRRFMQILRWWNSAREIRKTGLL